MIRGKGASGGVREKRRGGERKTPDARCRMQETELGVREMETAGGGIRITDIGVGPVAQTWR
jgi:hypothetical protein